MKKLLYILLFISTISKAQVDLTHHVPVDKGKLPDIFSNERKPFTGAQLKTIGMPCGGIAAGQLYVRGDGTLACWWIANNAYNTGYGHKSTNDFQTPFGVWKDCYQTFTPQSPVDQGFTINGRPLDANGFDAIEFTGEYPVATINYKDSKKPLPFDIKLLAFSPFIPLDAKESATPGTVMQYTIKNVSNRVQTVNLTGHLQNPVGLDGTKLGLSGVLRNTSFRVNGLIGVSMDLIKSNLPALHPWNGNVTLSLIGEGNTSENSEKPFGEKLIAQVGQKFTLKPGQSKTVTILVTWYFPNRQYPIDAQWGKQLPANGNVLGNNYANWFSSSKDVAEWLDVNLPRLQKQTFAFHDAYYNNSSLPYWLNRRLLAPLSILATETCQWWGNGKFYAWEGVGSCIGNCTHVWNYEQALAHFFPELERNMREQNDLSTAMQTDGGVLTRNDHPEFGVAVDGQCGAVLKAYREHLDNKDDLFLTRNWPKIKMAMKYLIKIDGNSDGIIDGEQPNTYDDKFFGANTYAGSLYLAALKASVEMGRIVNDKFADTCAAIAKLGAENTSKKLYNSEYFIQDVNLKEHPDNQYGKGCLADQLFGQTWADLTGLGDLYNDTEIKSTLQSIYKYNWAPDVSAQTKFHPAERDYASAGEAGLLICTWPHDPHPGNHGVRYRDEVWTGIEYQVATSMISHGMLTEGLNIIKGLDDRYQPEKHNPWNEIECGDHYSRAMASWGVMLALQGFHYDGPAQSISIDPQLNPEHFESFFTAAEGWGNIAQTTTRISQTNTIHLKYGRLSLKHFSVPFAGHYHVAYLILNGKPVGSIVSINDHQLTASFDLLDLKPGDQLTLTTRL